MTNEQTATITRAYEALRASHRSYQKHMKAELYIIFEMVLAGKASEKMENKILDISKRIIAELEK